MVSEILPPAPSPDSKMRAIEAIHGIKVGTVKQRDQAAQNIAQIIEWLRTP